MIIRVVSPDASKIKECPIATKWVDVYKATDTIEINLSDFTDWLYLASGKDAKHIWDTEEISRQLECFIRVKLGRISK